MTIMAATYPGFEVTEDRTAIWFSAFREIPAAAVSKALKQFIREDKSAFAPTPGQLFALLPADVKHEAPVERSDSEKYDTRARLFEQIRRDWEDGFATIRRPLKDNQRFDKMILVPLNKCFEVGTWNWEGDRIPRYDTNEDV